MYEILKKKGLAIGVSAAVVLSLGIGSVSYYNYSNSQGTGSDEVVTVEAAEEVDVTAPVITVNETVIHTNNLDSVVYTDYVSVEDESEISVTLDHFVKISDPTAYNDETKQGFIDQLSGSTDATLIEELDARLAETPLETKEDGTMVDGIYQASFVATDEASNQSAVSILLVYDTTGPDISHDESTEKQTVSDPTQAPTVSVAEGQIVDAFDGAIAPEAATVEVVESDADNHVYTVNISAGDALGNVSTISYTITLEKQQAGSAKYSGGTTKSSGSSGTSKSGSSGSSGGSGTPSAGDTSAVGGEATVSQSGIYKYCPTYINGSVLYCSNEYNPGEVKDGIYLNGTRVLSTSSGGWDSVQVCDPTVISGIFSYQGTGYTYLMAYLGCATYDCTANEVGFAVSNDLYNWKKVGRAVAAARDGYWGVGQPSLISKDGNVFLFYTSGTASATTTYAKQLLDGNFDNGIQLSDRVRISCGYDFISNADFAFSGSTLYMTCDTHPFPSGSLSFISAVQSVYQGEWDGTLSGLGSIGWTRIAQIGSGTTGHERNHNGCFVRGCDGSLAERAIYVSTGDSVGDWMANLCTYRFQRVGF